MSDETAIKSKGGGGFNLLNRLISNGQNMKGALARVYPMYQRLQTQRFQTMNASEGGQWPDLNAEYKKYKPRRYGGGPRRKSKKRAAGRWNSYPGAGSKMMIGTGMLAGAVIGPSDGSPFTDGTANHRAMFTATQMVISVEESGNNPDGNKFDYPHFAAEHRPFMSFGAESIEEMREAIQQFLMSDGGVP